MIITDIATSSRNKPTPNMEPKKGDILKLKEFNALPSPVTARMCGGGEYWIESLCVQTGFMRLDVSGQIDHSEFSMVKILIDSDGVEHEPDDFWIDELSQEPAK